MNDVSHETTRNYSISTGRAFVKKRSVWKKMQVIKGEEAFTVAVQMLVRHEVPEGAYILDTPDIYLAIYNPDENTIRGKMRGFYNLEEAEGWMEEQEAAYQRQYMDDWEVARCRY